MDKQAQEHKRLEDIFLNAYSEKLASYGLSPERADTLLARKAAGHTKRAWPEWLPTPTSVSRETRETLKALAPYVSAVALGVPGFIAYRMAKINAPGPAEVDTLQELDLAKAYARAKRSLQNDKLDSEVLMEG